ncbi:amidohydrolase family protein [Aerococcus urinae]|uniref:amidohydrolase family protein n=1 Tax=Aerococcus urinae TaxID=1376 RepID=UPI00254B94C5|nr:amidohydrolase family protein [Aerococcus urinae]MDK6371110.1 amidohydrolase family protein [Aerococcus urinae]
MFIDMHSHIPFENGNYCVQKLLEDMATYKIDKRVVSAANDFNEKENNLSIINICDKYKEKLYPCATINPKKINIINDLSIYINDYNVKIFEFNPIKDGYFPDLMNNLDEIFTIINKVPSVVKLFTGYSCYGIPQQWEKYIANYKNISFVFLHMACFDYGYTCVDVVSRHKNAYTETSNQYELQILRKNFKKLSSSKIIFGTSFPERLTSSAILIFDNFDLPEETKNNIFRNNALSLLGRVL